jgi:hypothetical protein
MTTNPDPRNYVAEHFENDVQPGNIVFYPTCRVCGGRLRFDYHPDQKGFGYRHVPEEAHQ